MDSLPLEILNLIIRAGDHTQKKAPFAALSKTWQAAIERYTFARLYVQTHELADFKRILSSENRRAALGFLRWRVNLPPYRRDEDGEAEPETADEQAENDAIFTRGIVDLLSVMKAWEEEMPGLKMAKMLELDISAEARSPELVGWGFDAVNSNRFSGSLLHLRIDNPLPTLERPVSFQTDDFCLRNIKGESVVMIACGFKNLIELHIQLFDGEKVDSELRQQQRYDMAKQLGKIKTQSLTQVYISITQYPTRNEDYPAPTALHASDPSTDHLSEALHQLSLAPCLKHFSITGFAVISQVLFWPKPGAEHVPTWPNLEVFQVQFDMKTPDGGWYYLHGGQPRYLKREIQTADGEDDENEEAAAEEEDLHEDEDEFSEHYLEEDAIAAREKLGESPYNPTRNIPDTTKLVPLFRALAQAAGRMPKLRLLMVAPISTQPRRIGCEVFFAAPGVFGIHDKRVTKETRRREEMKGTYRLVCIGSAADETCLDIWREEEAKMGRELHVYIL